MHAPKALGLLLVQVVVLILQMIPPIGIVLMMLAAPFWSILLVNGAFIGIAIEAAKIPGMRRWLILPVLWFGSYAAWVGVSEYMDMRALKRAEAGSSIGPALFDPRTQALVLRGDKVDRSDPDNRADWFVAHTSLPSVFQRDATFPDVRYSAVRLASMDQCKGLSKAGEGANDAGVQHVRIWAARQSGGKTRQREFDKRVCVWSGPEIPTMPTAEVTFERSDDEQRDVTITISAANGLRKVLRASDKVPRSWIPLPILGCGLNSGNNSWDCKFGFMPALDWSLSGRDKDLEASNRLAARALGLQLIAPADRRPVDRAVIEAADRLSRDRAARLELVALDQILAEPGVSAPWPRLGNLAQRPGLLGDRLEPAMALVEKGQRTGSGAAYDNARAVFGMFQNLPKPIQAPYQARLKALGVVDENFTSWEERQRRLQR
ncbi:hypothetical protein [Caulobacter sp. RHG1]|uniref:hypothetical protein n=1 Tax=Caulobacter sp. (strain RHG1) TaxID=2545762 RepID=UPI0019D60A47|nr:hypothetical protein [Caulobacter sp. RHG1]